jgi:hypothetical protein
MVEPSHSDRHIGDRYAYIDIVLCVPGDVKPLLLRTPHKSATGRAWNSGRQPACSAAGPGAIISFSDMIVLDKDTTETAAQQRRQRTTPE